MTELNEPAKKKRPKWQIILGSVVAVLVALIALGAIFGEDKKDKPVVASAPATTTAATTVPTTTVAPTATSVAPAVVTTSPTAVTSTAAAAPAAKVSDPRCVPASNDLTFLVSSGLSKAGYVLTNGTVIKDGALTFYGATTVDSGGKMANRSDVWVVKDNMVYTSTGGARAATSWTKASGAPLNISAADERVQAVDKCVVNITTS